jgi:hypothetical protein
VPWESVIRQSSSSARDIGVYTQAKSGNIELLCADVSLYPDKVASEQDMSIGAIFKRKKYLDVPLILSTGQTACSYAYDSYMYTKFSVHSWT